MLWHSMLGDAVVHYPADSERRACAWAMRSLLSCSRLGVIPLPGDFYLKPGRDGRLWWCLKMPELRRFWVRGPRQYC